MEISNIKETLNEKVDAELAAFEQSKPAAKRDEFFFSELEIKTAFRSALYNAPISDEVAQFIMDKGDILHNMFDFFAANNHFRDSSDTMEGSVYQATITYIENAEHDYLANKVYERVKQEYEQFIDDVKKLPTKIIIEEAREFIAAEDLMRSLDPETSKLDTFCLKGLLSFDNLLFHLCDEWKKCDYTLMTEMADAKVSIMLKDNILTIRDEGIGIPPDDLKHIFDKFYKALSEQNKSGTGLGLAIAKQIADRHEIKLSVESQESKGTIFTFKL